MGNKYLSILEMNNKDAKNFFLKSESYFNAELPNHINFDEAIKSANKLLLSKKGNTKDIKDVAKSEPKHHSYQEQENLNPTIIVSKGEYSWRTLTILHPILYVDLVNFITQPQNWECIVKRFKTFQKNKNISCYSLPVVSNTDSQKKNKAETILNWWENVEQSSVKLSIKYDYSMHTDITDCYPSIYTHSIAWALHGKDKVKKDENKGRKFIGGKIDSKISKMQYNQTNGIPQGSALMDFIAEIVLGYADLELTNKLKNSNIFDYDIIRYRDDYRIFSNSKHELEMITKILSEVLYDLNFKLNTNKTKMVDNIVIDSIKPAKLYWNEKRSGIRHHYKDSSGYNKISYNLSLQKHLLEIKKFADKFPNSGQLLKALNEFHKERIKQIQFRQSDSIVLIGIILDIMIRNPRSIPNCVMIIGDLLKMENEETVNRIVKDIQNKYQGRTNTDLVEIWLQRLLLLFDTSIEININNRLSCKIEDPSSLLFPIDWLEDDQKNKFNEGNIVNIDSANKMKNAILASELEFFEKYSR